MKSPASTTGVPDPLDGFEPLDDLLSLGSRHVNFADHQAGNDVTSVDSPTTWRFSSNAFQMEMQDNAKIPILYHWNMDRGSSTRQSHHTADLEEMSRLDAQDVSLTERFLKMQSRASMQANYAQAGALSAAAAPERTKMHANFAHQKSYRRATVGGPPLEISFDSNDDKKMEVMDHDDGFFNALAVNVDPTPLAEMGGDVLGSSTSTKMQEVNYYPYGRAHQLPLPTKNVSPPSSPSMRSQQSASVHGDGTATALMPGGPQLMLPGRVVAAARALPRGALQDAANKKSQYGFGANHVVPSIPEPPVSKKKRVSPPPPAPKKVTPPPVVRDSTPLPPAESHSVTSSSSTADGNGGATTPTTASNGDVAYERKKQRAKDSRVKLNDSIEKLSIAINLAGLQSKARLQQWSTGQGRAIVQESIDVAENAKKWDRPSFVGSAAAIIHGLNAQCEALMRECVSLREQVAASSALAPTGGSLLSDAMAPFSCTNKRFVSDYDGCSGDEDISVPPSPKKQRRLRDTNKNSSTVSPDDRQSFDDNVFQEKILDRIATMLDPISLARCQQVCREWHHVDSFRQVAQWENSSNNRFGYYNVRQWRAKLDDDDAEMPSSPLKLYRSMDAANVMPHFAHDGMFLLGEGRLPGKVSAWTFLVERSNGETLRSVKQDPSSGGRGYTSLPIVELRTVIQNTGISDAPVVLRDQSQTVDASTRRRGEEMKEVEWDDRFAKRVLNIDGTERILPPLSKKGVTKDVCRLDLFECAVLQTFVYARSCTTTSKFVQRANFTKVLVTFSSGVTVPLVITFPRDSSLLQH